MSDLETPDPFEKTGRFDEGWNTSQGSPSADMLQVRRNSAIRLVSDKCRRIAEFETLPEELEDEWLHARETLAFVLDDEDGSRSRMWRKEFGAICSRCGK